MIRLFGTLILVTISTAAGFSSVELSYRYFLMMNNPEQFRNLDNKNRPGVWFLQYSRWKHHPDFGYTYGSETIHGGSASNGQVISCWSWPANDRGNMGLIRGEYDTADIKILVFGDSFTAQIDTGSDPRGITWPDYLQDYLSERTNKTVHVVNFGRDGIGLLQMVDLARAKVKQWKPDLIVFSFITDDLTRDRFFRTPIVHNGRERVITTRDPRPTPPISSGSDTAIVHSDASKEWCEEMQARGGPVDDPVLREMEEVVIDAQARSSGKPDFWAIDRSFVWDRLVHNNPFYTTYKTVAPTQNPRIDYNSYSVDPRFVEGVNTLKQSGVPIALTHLSIYHELAVGQVMIGNDQQHRLLNSLADLFGEPVLFSADYGDISQEQIADIKRSTEDTHPSDFGMKYYADAIANLLINNGYVD